MADTETSSNLKVLVFMGDLGQDPTEVAVPVSILKANGVQVDFATEHGKEPHADPRMLGGPVGMLFGAAASAKKLYYELTTDPAWKSPRAWSSLTPSDIAAYDGVMLPGGHDKPLRQYFESESLHALLAAYFPLTKRGNGGPSKVVGAICHGVLPLARAKNEQGKSVLEGVETTTLPKHMEKGIYYATAPVLGSYYRTYPEYTADEVESLVGKPFYKNGGVTNMAPFVVVDKTYRYVSGRFPGDAELFANTFLELMKERA